MAIPMPSSAPAPAVQENVNSQASEPKVDPAAPAAAVDPRDEIYAKKERAFRAQQKAFQTERDALKAKMAEYETGYVPKSRLKDATWDVLNEAGVDYDKLTQDLLNQPNMNDPATRAMMQKLKALEDKQNASERSAAEAQERAYTQALNDIRTEATMVIDSDPSFETVKAEGMVDAVVDLIDATFKADGHLLTVKEAAEQIENYLVDTGAKLAQYSKVKSRLAPAVPVAPIEATSAPQAPKSQTPKITTLTNNIATQSATNKKQNDAERRARAMAAFRGELK